MNNKPIIAYRPVPNTLWNTAHIEILGENGIYFKDENEFNEIINKFDPKKYENKDLNFYKEYSPEKVMKIFDDVFIKSSVKED